MKTRERHLGVIFIAVLVSLSAVGCAAATQATYPTKPIEFVVHGAQAVEATSSPAPLST